MYIRLAGVAFMGLVLAGTPAEARRLFWWQQDVPSSDIYSDVPVEQDVYAQDQFNQEQYDLYMRQMHHKKQLRQYDQTYYEPQVKTPSYRPRVLKPKKKIVTQAAVPESIVPTPPIKAPVAQRPVATGQVASIGKRYQTDTPAKSIDCSKGAAIVSGYGFSGVTTKSCSGGTYVYGAVRGGSNFEIQVSSASGELTAVKKL